MKRGKAEHDVKHRTKEGEIRDVHVIVKQIVLSGKTVLHAIWRDITERKRAENLLKASEDRFAKTFLLSPVAITIVRAGDGRFVEINSAAEKMLGYRRDELIGRTSLETGLYLHPEDRTRLFLELARKGTLHDFEISLRNKNGRPNAHSSVY